MSEEERKSILVGEDEALTGWVCQEVMQLEDSKESSMCCDPHLYVQTVFVSVLLLLSFC